MRLLHPGEEVSARKAKAKGGVARRLTIRVSDEDYQKLAELRLALHLPSDGAALRALIRIHYTYEQRALRRARREPGHSERVAALVDHRQLDMFRRSTSGTSH
jgi:hypothetical protein